MKIITTLTIITLAILGNTETGWLKLACWVALAIEFFAFTIYFERRLECSEK